jgi:hypothetical protein
MARLVTTSLSNAHLFSLSRNLPALADPVLDFRLPPQPVRIHLDPSVALIVAAFMLETPSQVR